MPAPGSDPVAEEQAAYQQADQQYRQEHPQPVDYDYSKITDPKVRTFLKNKYKTELDEWNKTYSQEFGAQKADIGANIRLQAQTRSQEGIERRSEASAQRIQDRIDQREVFTEKIKHDEELAKRSDEALKAFVADHKPLPATGYIGDPDDETAPKTPLVAAAKKSMDKNLTTNIKDENQINALLPNQQDRSKLYNGATEIYRYSQGRIPMDDAADIVRGISMGKFNSKDIKVIPNPLDPTDVRVVGSVKDDTGDSHNFEMSNEGFSHLMAVRGSISGILSGQRRVGWNKQIDQALAERDATRNAARVRGLDVQQQARPYGAGIPIPGQQQFGPQRPVQ
jgi:hypothetical protein